MDQWDDQSEKPIIFTFTFGTDVEQSQFQSTHSRLLNFLFERSTLRHATTAQQAIALFSECRRPKAVFVADAAILRSCNQVITQKLVQYAAGGGIVVFGGLFSNDADMDDLNDFFMGTWDLPWETGSQHRTTLALNRAAVDPSIRDKLPASYCQTAVFLHGVERPDAWYLPTQHSIIESYVPLPGPVGDMNETPVALARFGNGKVGYIGDVGAESGTDEAILGMLDLLV